MKTCNSFRTARQSAQKSAFYTNYWVGWVGQSSLEWNSLLSTM